MAYGSIAPPDSERHEQYQQDQERASLLTAPDMMEVHVQPEEESRSKFGLMSAAIMATALVAGVTGSGVLRSRATSFAASEEATIDFEAKNE